MVLNRLFPTNDWFYAEFSEKAVLVLIDRELASILTYKSIPILNCTASRAKMAWSTIWASGKVLMVELEVVCKLAPPKICSMTNESIPLKNTFVAFANYYWPLNE